MLIVANWKAYVESFQKAQMLVQAARRAARATSHTIVLAPPAPFLSAFARRSIGVRFAAQNVSATQGGAKTGEIIAAAYKAAGATHAIIGHSERRALGETDALIAEKLMRALAQGLIPILCVGEGERDSEGRYLGTVREQISAALAALGTRDRAQVVIAYEPVWAIGKTGADVIAESDLTEMVLYIRKVLAELLPGKQAASSDILYGGSVEVENVRGLAGATGVNGFLVGHASVDPKQFSALVRALA